MGKRMYSEGVSAGYYIIIFSPRKIFRWGIIAYDEESSLDIIFIKRVKYGRCKCSRAVIKCEIYYLTSRGLRFSYERTVISITLSFAVNNGGRLSAAVVSGTPVADSVSDSVETAMPAVSADECVAVSALSCVLPWFVNIINAAISRMRTADRIIIIEICFLLFNLLMLQ